MRIQARRKVSPRVYKTTLGRKFLERRGEATLGIEPRRDRGFHLRYETASGSFHSPPSVTLGLTDFDFLVLAKKGETERFGLIKYIRGKRRRRRKKKERMIKNREGSRNEETFVSVFRACKRSPDMVNYRRGREKYHRGLQDSVSFL